MSETVRCVLCLLLLAFLAGPQPGHAAAQPPLEYQVKAAFLLNFTKFIEWPGLDSDPASPFTICILGEDPFGPTLDQIVEGESIAGHKVAIRRAPRELPKGCQILYIGKSEKGVQEILAGLDHGVLAVGEGDRFTRDGGMIGFIVENRRVRFNVNLTAAKRAGLQISSQLLQVARSVER